MGKGGPLRGLRPLWRLRRPRHIGSSCDALELRAPSHARLLARSGANMLVGKGGARTGNMAMGQGASQVGLPAQGGQNGVALTGVGLSAKLCPAPTEASMARLSIQRPP
jgi:hypothetical protein